MPRAALAVVFCCTLHATAQACGNEPTLEELKSPQVDQDLGDVYELVLENSAHRELLERSQQLWQEYRQTNCELMSIRDAGASPEAMAQCTAFMARERSLELRLLAY